MQAVQHVVHEVEDVHDKEEVGHARREVIEAGFRRRASAKDEKKLVQSKSEVLTERCDKRKEKS